VTAPFDPYRDWLGISGARGSINYYRLCGLKDFESDPAVIEAAADAAIARVQKIPPGDKGEHQTRVLRELRAAKACLLDPAARARYDVELRAAQPLAMAIPIADPATIPPAAVNPADAVSILLPEATQIPQRLQSAPRRTSLGGALGATIGFVIAASILAAIGFTVWQIQSTPATTAHGGTNESSALPVGDDAATNQTASSKPQRPSTTVAENPVKTPQPALGRASPDEPTATLPPLPVTAARIEPKAAPRSAPPSPEFAHAMKRARTALVQRDLKSFDEQFAAAEQHARSDDDRAELRRLATLAAQYRRFFDVVRAGLQKIEPPDEIPFGKRFIVVIERGPESLSVFDERARRDYTLATLPAELVLFAAKAGADENSPPIKVATAAFLTVDPGGDREAARRLLTEARAADQRVDDLMGFTEGSSQSLERDKIPDAEQVKEAMLRVDKDHLGAMNAAASAAQKSDLAVKLIATSQSAESAADQYALLEKASELAVSAGDARLAIQAIDELSRWFDVDGLALKAESLSQLSVGRSSPAAAKFVARRALELAGEAKSSNRIELARSLAEAASNAARKARDPDLVKRVTEMRRQVAPAGKKGSKAASGG
jgi:hypothetical protein